MKSLLKLTAALTVLSVSLCAMESDNSPSTETSTNPVVRESICEREERVYKDSLYNLFNQCTVAKAEGLVECRGKLYNLKMKEISGEELSRKEWRAISSLAQRFENFQERRELDVFSINFFSAMQNYRTTELIVQKAMEGLQLDLVLIAGNMEKVKDDIDELGYQIRRAEQEDPKKSERYDKLGKLLEWAQMTKKVESQFLESLGKYLLNMRISHLLVQIHSKEEVSQMRGNGGFLPPTLSTGIAAFYGKEVGQALNALIMCAQAGKESPLLFPDTTLVKTPVAKESEPAL